MMTYLLNIMFGLLDNIFVVSHVAKGSSFPEPLSEEEEKFYLQKYKNENDMVAKNILIEHNLRLVAYIANKYTSTGIDLDDLISTGSFGLIKAVNTFDGSKGAKLSSYASRCIENEILMNIRSVKKNKNDVSLQEAVGFDKEGSEICLMDVIGTEGDMVFDEVERKIQISKLSKELLIDLKDMDRKIIEMRYGLKDGRKRTQQEIAKIYGISRSYISRIENMVIKKLRKKLNPESDK